MAVPARPNIPQVEFVAPDNPKAVTCLNQDGVDAMLHGEEALRAHVKKLETIIEDCR